MTTPNTPINAKSQQSPRTGTDKQNSRTLQQPGNKTTIKTPTQTNTTGGKINLNKGSQIIKTPNQWSTSSVDKNCSTQNRGA